MGFSSPRQTERGFEIVDFDDFNQVSCSLQQSSVVGHYKDSLQKPGTSCVWLGINSFDAVSMRMHLDREQVAGLVKHLQSWLDTGSFAKP
jgi:hypothetical protein